ncbi:3-oxoacyl-[acyl-carrier protein] reductase [Moritella sp. JT01]|uniref:SDR family NAD(P)-dependent oxidoreductase n=1 Tax=Moritella sp. JT01 TaxID=756698 RepID=UPI000799D29F|nr:SDR family oxidoreductase [Moritella sp. JT01]KXO12878.1 3-oxoacyl-[acyl-carrier protein] reductase [Moritella sp. JT01]
MGITSAEGSEKRILIIGATSDLGSITCHDLAKKGYSILLIGRSENKLKELNDLLPGVHQMAIVDLLIPDQLTDIIVNNANEYGGFSGGVYCAGVHSMMSIRKSTYLDFEQTYRVNCGGALAMIKAFTRKKVRKNDHTSLVLLSSVSQSVGEQGVAAYAASKGALGSLCRCAALELAKDKVTVNCIAAGMIKTSLNIGYQGVAPSGHFQQLSELHPLGFGSPSDISEAIIYLLESRWTTGSTLYVDGGYTCR